MNKKQKIREALANNPDHTNARIAKRVGATVQYVANIRAQMELWQPPEPLPMPEVVAHDNVNSPMHYKQGGIETIDFIEAKELNYHLGNVVKYIARADHKNDRYEDLLKARWYLNREIAKYGSDT